VAVSSQIVRYQLDDSTVVGFEFDPGPDWYEAGTGEIVGQVRKAVTPAVAAAKAVLEQVKEIAPDDVEVKFGVKVTGEANWIVARAATEGSFEITLSWSLGSEPPKDAQAAMTRAVPDQVSTQQPSPEQSSQPASASH
jgi:hypothetical protein